MTWVVIGLVLAVFSGLATLPFMLAFRPWRVRRVAYLLMARWPWYRSYVRRLVVRRWTVSVNRAMREVVLALAPVMEETARRWAAFGEALVASGALLEEDEDASA